MIKVDPIIAVKDVEVSSKWYQKVFGCHSMHGGKEFDILVTEKNEILLCLHKWEAHGHRTMKDPDIPHGNGLILYFRTDAMKKIRENVAAISHAVAEDIHLNENSTKLEFSLKDPDGYYLTISEFHTYEG